MKNSTYSSPTNPSGAKLLFVEHCNDQWEIIQTLIRQYLPQVNPLRANSAQQAMKLLRAGQQQEWELPQLILLDLHLPSLVDGWQLLTAIKALTAPARWIPTVVLSSSLSREDVVKAYQAGAASYLRKPIELAGWQILFEEVRANWWETVRLPPMHYIL
ncbi:response regulator [Spirosoma sp. KNUC1025]|uniref:response regulator n=1 Tax=Spirosoma sp. KNUC1025 TaxID=2894082 RepID=UPI001E5C9386|nr:response regulator [Spirosoma sp. KNUC1025]UFH57626.1 response regulator [Spirosoma sp. KNUC1025]